MRRIHPMPFGTEFVDGMVRFSLWAPSARQVTLIIDGTERDMVAEEGGWHRLTDAKARAGSLYRYRIDGELVIPDPASRFQPEDIEGPSQVVDPGAYLWTDGDWRGRPWEEAVIYEAHVGTATTEGTFAALTNKLDHLLDLGVTALELMPVADYPGDRGWGYDGVLLYAPDHAYGTPDDLKRLVDEAHRRGIMVILDVVYNHFGPSGNYLPTYAASFFTDRHKTPWGDGINFDGHSAEIVRDYFVHNALYWLEEYHFDGLRFDAVHAIADDSSSHVIGEFAKRIRDSLHGRKVHLILENAANEARWLARDDVGQPVLHNAQWTDDTHHAWHRLLTGETDGYYADYDDPVGRLGRCLAEGFAYQGEFSDHEGAERGEPSAHLPPSAFVNFLQNHDQIGNRAQGERIHMLTEPYKLSLARAGLLLAPQIPMLFMGEEWQASTPFQYFVDFPDPELSRAVRDGRRLEFAGFGGFAAEEVPDPTDPQTLARSRLDWAEIAREPHSEVLAETKSLLRLRQDHIVPLTKTGFLGARCDRPSPDVLDIVWNFRGGRLRFVANFGTDHAVREGLTDYHTLWASAGVRPGPEIHLGSWQGAIQLSRR